jgi:DNA-binding NarL/FixJ family response regulator
MPPTKSKGSGANARPTRVLLVDDHPLVREGLAEVLRKEADLVICGQAEDRLQALNLIPKVEPDLAIIDLTLKNTSGLELIKDIRSQFPKIRMLVVSMHDELLHAQRALRAGASGFIAKGEATEHVVQAVRQVLSGKTYASERVSSAIVSQLSGHSRSDSGSVLANLTDRELEIFQLIGDGMGRQQIAKRLHLDVNTIETYRSRIKEKLGLKDAQELLQYAIRFNRASGPTA